MQEINNDKMLEKNKHEIIIFVNGEKLEEDYINLKEEMYVPNEIHVVVPEDKVFVMGDNRNHSIDSRAEVGFVDEDEILGSYLLRYSK